MIYAYAALSIAVCTLSQRLRDRRKKLLLLAAFALAMVAAPLIVRSDASINTMADIGIYVILALGLNIVVGFAGLLDLGYAAFFAIGAYTYGMLAGPQFGLHLPIWVLIFLAAAIAALCGIILGAPTLRLHGDYLAIVTLGFGEIVPQVFQNLTKYTGGPNGLSGLDTPSLGKFSFGVSSTPYLYVTLALIVLTLWLVTNLKNSRLGRAWMAIREDQLAAEHSGINTTAVKLAAFALGASFSGLGGVVFAAKLSLVSPDLFGFQVSVLIVSMLVLGGMGNINGVVIGAVILALVNGRILPQINAIVNGALHTNLDLTNYSFFIYGAILVALMLFRPEGLLPSRERRAELHAPQPPEAA